MLPFSLVSVLLLFAIRRAVGLVSFVNHDTPTLAPISHQFTPYCLLGSLLLEIDRIGPV